MNCVPVQPLHIVLLIQPSISQSTAKVNVPTSLVVPLIAPDAVLKVMIKRGSKLFFRLLPLCCYAFTSCFAFRPRKQRIPVSAITATATQSTT